MPTKADPFIEALRAQHDALAALVTSLDEAALTSASGASEWTVAQALSHLGSAAEITLAALDANLSGVDKRGEDFNQGVWDRWNAKSPVEMAADFVSADEALVARLEATDEATRTSARFDMGFLPEPVGLDTFLGFRLHEYTLHAWDVLVAFDPAATLPTPGLSLLIDHAGLMFRFIAHGDALGGKHGALEVRISTPDRSFGVDLGESIELVAEPGAPDGVLSLPAEAWLRLVAGRLAPAHTPASVTLTGDLVDLADLRRAFPGY